MKQCTLVKIGGQVIDNSDKLKRCLDAFSSIPGKKILIHGGGKSGSDMLKKLGIEVKYIDGRRITNKKTLEVVTQVYAGSVNKKIVAQLQARNISALGLSGCDLNIIQAEKRPSLPMDYGYAGDIKKVHTDKLEWLLSHQVCPVINPITHNGEGQLLNTNADTIAAEVAISLSSIFSINLHYCFEMPGVMMDINNPHSLLNQLTQNQYTEYQESGIIAAGMIPKLSNGFRAVSAGNTHVTIGSLNHFISGDPHTILRP